MYPVIFFGTGIRVWWDWVHKKVFVPLFWVQEFEIDWPACENIHFPLISLAWNSWAFGKGYYFLES